MGPIRTSSSSLHWLDPEVEMGVISRSAQARVPFVGSRLLALACMIERVVRRMLRACLARGGPFTYPAYPANFAGRCECEIDNRRSTSVCQARKSAQQSLTLPTSNVGTSNFHLTAGQRCSLFSCGETVLP